MERNIGVEVNELGMKVNDLLGFLSMCKRREYATDDQLEPIYEFILKILFFFIQINPPKIVDDDGR